MTQFADQPRRLSDRKSAVRFVLFFAVVFLFPKFLYSQSPNFRISGTIVNSIDSNPLANARVSLLDVRNRANALSVVTSEDGRFEFANLQSGKFALEGAKRGFLTAAYEQHQQYSTAIVTGPDFATENLVLRLTPLARVSGHIFDESGEAVRNAEIRLYKQGMPGGVRQTTTRDAAMTDDQGTYEFPTLAPGNYYLSVNAKPWYAVHPPMSRPGANSKITTRVDASLDVVYPETFYDGATDSASATTIELNGGDRKQIDVHLSPVPALHILVHVPTEGPAANGTPVLQRQTFDSPVFAGAENVQMVAPGLVEIAGIAPGRYAMQMAVPGTIDTHPVDIDLRSNGQELTAPEVEPPATIRFSAKFLRDQPVPKPLYIRLMNSQRRGQGRQFDSQGSASFEMVAPGKYSIFVLGDRRLYFVARAVSQGREVSVHDFNVGAEAALDVTLFLTDGNVTIEGVVKRAGKPVPGAMVVLVPKDPQSHEEFIRRDQSDFDGSFTLREAFPGTYTLIALDDAWSIAWREPATLQRYLARGKSITITPDMQATITLPAPIESQLR